MANARGCDARGLPRSIRVSAARVRCGLGAHHAADLYEVRDKCAIRKWPRFADQMIAALSSMFRQAVKRGKMPFNPCTGMDNAHKADPNSNREWSQEEWNFAREIAPLEVLIPMMLARHCGLRRDARAFGR